MKIISDIRHSNLMALLSEANNNQSEVARRASTTASHINSLINKRTRGSGGKIVVGSDLARKLEDGFGKPTGWLDEDHAKRLSHPVLGDLSDSEVEFASTMLDLYRKNKLTSSSIQQLKKMFAILIETD